jgi:hypothetical protein
LQQEVGSLTMTCDCRASWPSSTPAQGQGLVGKAHQGGLRQKDHRTETKSGVAPESTPGRSQQKGPRYGSAVATERGRQARVSQQQGRQNCKKPGRILSTSARRVHISLPGPRTVAYQSDSDRAKGRRPLKFFGPAAKVSHVLQNASACV